MQLPKIFFSFLVVLFSFIAVPPHAYALAPLDVISVCNGIVYYSPIDSTNLQDGDMATPDNYRSTVGSPITDTYSRIADLSGDTYATHYTLYANKTVIFRLFDSTFPIYLSDPVQLDSTANYNCEGAPRDLTALSPVKAWVSKNLLDLGVRFDLKAEAYKDNTLVSSGQVDSVQVGSGSFNNATLVSIPFNSFSALDFPESSALKVKIYARNACTGSLFNSGTAKLWFNTNEANSRFDATIETVNKSYYLLNSFLLGTSAGTGPQQSISVAAGAKCSPFKSFGTWTITP